MRKTSRKGRRKAGHANKIIQVLLAVLLVLLGVMVGAGAALLPRDAQFAHGVTVAGVDVGGQTRQQASPELERVLSAVSTASVTLRAGEHTRALTMEDLGVVPDIAATLDAALTVGREGAVLTRVMNSAKVRLNKVTSPILYRTDEARPRSVLKDFASAINREPIDARAKWNGSRVEVIPGRAGTVLDVEGSMQAIRRQVFAAIAEGQSDVREVTLPFNEQQPRITTDALSAIDAILGSYSTSFASSSQNRAHNVEISARSMHGHVLLPGETFSFNNTVGARTAARGYRIAPVIVNGQMDSGLGGGVCQVSTTLYNAVLLANLPIVSRSHHSRPSSYVPSGLDATVSYNAIDFRFRNGMDTPIVVETGTANRRLLVRILGKGPAPNVVVERSGISALPGRTITRNDPKLPKGTRKVEKGGGGLAITVTRVAGGKREVVSRDRYIGAPTIIRVGTGPAVPTEKPPSNGEITPMPTPTPDPKPEVEERTTVVPARTAN